jgi:hydrogenase/urease accessory protein HupE
VGAPDRASVRALLLLVTQKPSILLRAAAAVLLLCPRSASGHELGTIRTFVTFSRGTYSIDVIVDREHLPPGFAAAPAPSSPRIRNLRPAEAPAVARILTEVLRNSRVAFDGRPAVPEAEWADPDPGASQPVLRLTGAIPGGARSFTWSNGLRLGTYLLTISTEGDPHPVREWIEGGETSRPFVLASRVVPPTRGAVVLQYLGLGYTHILPKGTDHILFVLGIFLLSRRLKPILLQVTSFTVAHTITLALTIYGIVSLRPAIVEPLIALSIVYVAVENVFTSELSPWRVALVFGFGLIHGMGFAGVLSELGLPRSEFLTALLSFNAGVELGQLTVILAAFLLVGLPFRHKPWYRRRVVIPLSIAIGAVGLYWAVQRGGAALAGR